jgi:hypothetical protein
VPTISTALDTEESSWHYELNSRLSADPSSVEESVHVDQYGQLYLHPNAETTTQCNDDNQNGLRVYVNAWSLDTHCGGLVFLSLPLTFVNSSSCEAAFADDGGEYVKHGGGDYYGLVCERNRTEWCQRGYKRDIHWPVEIGQTCEVRRTGVDKSRCYNSGWFPPFFQIFKG